MKNVLIASFDLEVGGVERSLIGMLKVFDYERYLVDLMLYSHTGDFMELLPEGPKLLAEKKACKTFRMPIAEVVKTGSLPLALARLLAKYQAGIHRTTENGYRQMQYMWKYSLPFLPKLDKKYDLAISYLWPHYFVAEKVEAATKIAWIHTDFSAVHTDMELDLKMWSKFDHMVAVSEECKNAFIKKYPILRKKVIVIENIASSAVIRTQADETDGNPMAEDRRFKLVTVARLSHAKGIDQAVKAMAILKKRGYEDMAWYVVGYGGDEAEIRRLITENGLDGQFILLGKKTNPYPYIKAADLYVQPSRYEGKAVTVVEAQILSKPVLVTNYTTATSQVRDGFDGVICELSCEGIANGIEKLNHDIRLREQLVANCKKTDYGNGGLEKLYSLIEEKAIHDTRKKG